MGVSFFSKPALISAEAFASFIAKGRTLTREHISSNCFILFLGEVDLAIPYSSSYNTTEGIPISFGDIANRFSATFPIPCHVSEGQACRTSLPVCGDISKLAPFELVSDGSAIPVFAFKMKDDIDTYSVFDVSDKLRQYGWQVPAYTMPEHAEDVAVLRIVIREGFSQDMAGMLLDDIGKAVAHFESIPEHKPKGPAPQFKH